MRRFGPVASGVAFAVMLGSTVANAGTTTWKIQPTPHPRGASYMGLSGVSCSSSTACTAVGWLNNRPLAERWDGISWKIQPTPKPAAAQRSELLGVSCPSATFCTAVGSYSTGVKTFTLAERWNGISWKIQPTPNRADSSNAGNTLRAVSCSSTTSCTAVGYSNGPLAERWNGTNWTIQPTPNPAEAEEPATLQGVSCPSITACTAVGFYNNGQNYQPVAERWNGRSWAIQALPFLDGSGGLDAVSCSSTTACTAVGSVFYDGFKTVTLAERWNGNRWSEQSAPSPSPIATQLNGVSCPTSTDCTAVGSNYSTRQNVRNLTLAERWNGTSWTTESTPNPAGAESGQLYGVSCVSSVTFGGSWPQFTTVCTAVGYYFTDSGTTLPLVERR